MYVSKNSGINKEKLGVFELLENKSVFLHSLSAENLFILPQFKCSFMRVIQVIVTSLSVGL